MYRQSIAASPRLSRVEERLDAQNPLPCNLLTKPLVEFLARFAGFRSLACTRSH
jgi:hypothetical protein